MEEIPNSIGLPVFMAGDEEFQRKLRLAKNFGVDVSSSDHTVEMEAYYFAGQVVIKDIRRIKNEQQ